MSIVPSPKARNPKPSLLYARHLKKRAVKKISGIDTPALIKK